MSEVITAQIVEEILKRKADGYLFHRESQNLEFKAQFSFSELPEYLRDFAGFANNSGGYIIFGISNSPRKIIGLNDKSFTKFEKIDPAEIESHLLETFSPSIQWEQQICQVADKQIGIIYVFMSQQKPIISKKDYGKNQEIKAGEIYYRYAGRTQRIQFSELSYIIEQRVKTNTNQLLSLITKLSVIGPANAAILDTERGIIQKDDQRVLVIDEHLIPKIKFIREGHFDEKQGATTLKLIGDVYPINSTEVVKTIQKRLIDQYPHSFTSLWEEVKKRLPNIKQNLIFQVIKENNLKNNPQYSAYNFLYKHSEDEYKKTGIIQTSTPSIYNQDAIDFIVKVLER